MNISVKADLSFPQRLSLRTADCGPSLGSEPEVGQSFKGSASHLTRPQSSVCPNDRRPQDSWVLFSLSLGSVLLNGAATTDAAAQQLITRLWMYIYSKEQTAAFVVLSFCCRRALF